MQLLGFQGDSEFSCAELLGIVWNFKLSNDSKNNFPDLSIFSWILKIIFFRNFFQCEVPQKIGPDGSAVLMFIGTNTQSVNIDR